MIEKSNKVSICANIASFAVYLISSYLWQHNTYQFWSRKCVGYHELRSPFSLAQSPKSLQLHQVNSESSQQVEPLTNSTNPTPQNNFSLTFQPWKNKISRISDNLWYKFLLDQKTKKKKNTDGKVRALFCVLFTCSMYILNFYLWGWQTLPATVEREFNCILFNLFKFVNILTWKSVYFYLLIK